MTNGESNQSRVAASANNADQFAIYSIDRIVVAGSSITGDESDSDTE